MNRKEFFTKVGFGAAAVLLPACMASITTGCEKDSSPGVLPSNIDFNLDVSSGSLATNGGFLVSNGIVVARTLTGDFLAISAACTHEGTAVNFVAGSNLFHCPNHGAEFSKTGAVTKGPASSNLTAYKTSLNGSTLRVYS